MGWLTDRRRFTLLLIGVIAFGGGIILGSRDFSARSGGLASTAPQIGFAAPDFELESLTGGSLKLSDLRGKVVMVNLWASWCAPCRAEMPAIDAIYRQYRSQGFDVIAVNTTYQDNEADARAFIKELGIDFPVALDRDGATSKRYALQAMPTTFFIKRDGTIADLTLGGPMTEASIAAKIEKLLNNE